MTTRQLALPLVLHSVPLAGHTRLSGEHSPTGAGVPSMKGPWAVPLHAESFLLNVLLAQKFLNTCPGMPAQGGLGTSCGAFLMQVGSSDLPFFVVFGDRCQAVLVSGSLH